MNIGKSIFFLLTIFLLFSCTEKNNFVSYQNQDINQDSVNVVLDSLNFYTSQDSTSNYNENPRLTIGNYTFDANEINSYSLLKFPDTPDSINEISNLQLKFYVADIGSDIPVNLKISKITKDWVENEVDINNAYSDSTWILNEQIESLEIEKEIFDISVNDSITIDEMQNLELLKETITDDWANNENYGIVLYSETFESHFQIYSSENYADSLSIFKPKLTFEYNTETNTDSIYTYDEEVRYDASVFTNPENIEIIEDRMIISNGNIKRTVVQFDLEGIDEIYENISETAVINKAELVLTNIQNYNPNVNWNLLPYLLKTADPNLSMEFDEDFEFISHTILTEENFNDEGEITVNITAILQALISNEKENYGIMIKSTRENSNFGFVEFNHSVSLNIIYTNPEEF